MKLKILSVHGVASWSWNIPSGDCSICHTSFDVCCPDCRFPGDDCPPVYGKCSHCFHIHCILKWLKAQSEAANASGAELCPLCRQQWEFKD